MSRKNQNARIQFKYSTIGGTQPTIAPSMDHTDGSWSPTDLYVGEFFLNAVDDTMWVRTLNGIVPLTSGTTSINISTYVNKTGDTMTGELVLPTMSATTGIYSPYIYSDVFSGGTYYGDGSNLTNIPYTTFTGGTVNGYTTFTNGVDLTSASVSANTIDTAGGLNFINGDVSVGNNLDVTGAVTATTYYGDGSNLTGLNISGFTGYWELETTNENSITTNFNSNFLLNGVEYGFVVGRINTLDNADYSAIVGGVSNNITDSTSSMIMSSSSNITGGANYGVILGGTGNNMDSVDYGFILGGNSNTNNGQNYSGIIGGTSNEIDGSVSSSVIVGGVNNDIGGLSSYNTIIGGYNNTISGTTNVVSNSIIGGNGNTIEGDLDNIIILGGVGVTATQENTTYVDNLNINTLGTGTSVNSLGIDTNGNVVVGSGGGTTPNLSQVLTQGNTTGGNDIVVTSGDNIQSSLNDTNGLFFPSSGETRLQSTDTPGGGFPTNEAYINLNGNAGQVEFEATNGFEVNIPIANFTGQVKIGDVGTGTSITNLGIDSNGTIVSGTTGGGGVQTYNISSSSDIDLYNDGTIRLFWDVSQTDIDMEVLTDPTTNQVHVTKIKDGTTSAYDIENSDGLVQIESAMGNDDRIQLSVYAPLDTNYPQYRFEIVLPSTLIYGAGRPFLVMVEKINSYS